MDNHVSKCANKVLRYFIHLKIHNFAWIFVIHIIHGRVTYVYIECTVKSLPFVLFSKKYGNFQPRGSLAYIHIKVNFMIVHSLETSKLFAIKEMITPSL